MVLRFIHLKNPDSGWINSRNAVRYGTRFSEGHRLNMRSATVIFIEWLSRFRKRIISPITCMNYNVQTVENTMHLVIKLLTNMLRAQDNKKSMFHVCLLHSLIGYYPSEITRQTTHTSGDVLYCRWSRSARTHCFTFGSTFKMCVSFYYIDLWYWFWIFGYHF